jgi:HlyD family secretion protein
MKTLKIMALSLFLIMLAGVSACSFGQKAGSQPHTTVTKGDITVKVNGTGKTSYANDAALAFGAAGKIEQINVKKGDTVNRGAVLARLETANLELALSQARVDEATARAAKLQSQMAVAQAQMAVTQAQQDVAQAASVQTQAEAALTLAQFNLDRIQAVGDIKDQIMKIQMLINAAEESRHQANLAGDSQTYTYFFQRLAELNQEYTKKNTDLQKLLAKDEYSGVAPYEVMAYDPVDRTFNLGGQTYNRLIVEDIQMKQQQVVIAQQSIELAKQNILKAQQNVAQANQNVEKTRQSVEQADLTLEQAAKAIAVAQKQLDSAVISAPFDGVVANLDVKTGDYYMASGVSGATPLYMVEPASLEIKAEVDEIDIAAVQVGQPAVIEMDAVSGLPIEGRVSSISLLPVTRAVNSGVVVYEVKVQFAGTPPAWVKSGMSANVEIVTIRKNSVLTVPNKALQQNPRGQKTVRVLVDNQSQEKALSLGLNDGTQSEVISGVNEGEVILLNP